jgi:acetyl-CoA carboxylase biotin carboxylase subunit
MLTGRDLVKEQILIASGHPLSFRQKDLETRGHVIECRVNAEDPARGFVPSPGKIGNLHLPGGPGIRVDTHLFAGAVIPPYYDSLVAKVLAQGEDREEAIVRMKRALQEFSVEGIHTTVGLLLGILDDPDFVAGSYDTGFLESRGQRTAGEEEAAEMREAGRLASA